ncbi:DUF6090 family protein, partial [Algoriphagus sp. SE2]|uniref:DUF6090 family protein n=1 Tax=Algoriphagus sp. SE2 TaxID=3141536 RepID=UPI0031CCE66D
QKLLTENKFSRYLIYAMGEIILVVIGILIALQVNNWNENKNLEHKTLISLSSLAEELNSNKRVLKSNIEMIKFDLRTGLNFIDSLNNNSISTEHKNTYLLDKILELGPVRVRSLTTNSLEEMISSGSYSAIDSETIKENLLAYNSEIENMNNELRRFEEHWRNIESPYITKHFSLLDMYARRGDSLLNEDAFLSGGNIPRFNDAEIYFENELDAFYNNREFASMYISRFFDLRAVIRAMYRLDVSIDKLLDDLTNVNG